MSCPYCLEPIRDQLRALVGEHADVRDVLGRDPAAGRAEFVDPVEQQVLCLGRQIDQQPLGDPCCRLGGVEAVVPQRLRPVVAKVDGDGASVGRGLGAQIGERLGLEIDHLGLVDLEHGRSVGPRQSIGAGVQPGGQDHRLTDTGGRGIGEQPVEVPGADRHALRRALHAEPGIHVLEVDLAVERPDEEVEADRAHQRLGERVVDQPSRWASTRCAATIVAVAPTLDARSHESSSVRAIMLLAMSP